jgi:chemotaxis protein methyltransferase CheR
VSNSEPKITVTHEQLMSDKEGYERLSKILFEKTGIYMDPSEKSISLMSNRLHKVLKKHFCNSYTEFIQKLDSGNSVILNEFLEVLTTNTTNFFRENEHFVYLRKNFQKIIDYLTKEKRNEIRVWCAASSTGEEPYTILMTILESLAFSTKYTVKINATDLNTQVLDKAKEGIYKLELTENIPQELLAKYFEKNQNTTAETIQIKEKYRKMIEFSKLNLMSDFYSFPYKFDIIFCRNVLIYFPQPIVESTVLKLSHCLHKEGFLFIGHTESMIGNKEKLKSVHPAIFQLIV